MLWAIHDAVTGLCFPAYETIAVAAGVGRMLVPRAILFLEDAHVLTWQHRLKWEYVAGVRLPRRTSNAYRFFDPGAVPTVPGTDRNGIGPNRKVLYSSEEQPVPSIDPQSAVEKALASFRQVLEAPPPLERSPDQPATQPPERSRLGPQPPERTVEEQLAFILGG